MQAPSHQIWNSVAEKYENVFMPLRMYDGSIEVFCNLLPTGPVNVLEIGCGPGNVTAYLLKRLPGLSVLATDSAAGMVERCAKNNPAARCQVLDCRQIATINQRFNGFIGGFCLPYLAPAEVQQLLADARRLLLPGGVLYLSYIEGNPHKPEWQTNSSGQRLFVHYYRGQQLQAMAGAVGFGSFQHLYVEYNKGQQQQLHGIMIAQVPPAGV